MSDAIDKAVDKILAVQKQSFKDKSMERTLIRMAIETAFRDFTMNQTKVDSILEQPEKDEEGVSVC